MDAYPNLKVMYTAGDGNTEVYYLKNATAQICSFTEAPREIVKRYKPFLDKIDLTYTQYITMMVMWEKKCVNVKELGECLYLDSGTLTPLLKKLQSKGLLTRVRSDKDERNLVVTITEEGERLKEQAVEIPMQIAGCGR